MASNTIYVCNILTGGAEGALDAINGATLTDGDCAIVYDSTKDAFMFYWLDDDNAGTVSAPSIIAPLQNPGDKRWLLLDLWGDNIEATTAFEDYSDETTVTEWSTDGTMGDDSETAYPTEKACKTFIDAFDTSEKIDMTDLPGFVNRPNFWFYTILGNDRIYIGPGAWHIDGTNEKIVYIPYHKTYIAFYLGSSGSNASSDDLVANTSTYIYIDDSSLSSDQYELLSEENIINSNTAPSFSNLKEGWYNGNDRCIFAVPVSSGAATIEPFFSVGKDIFYLLNPRSMVTATDIDSTFTNATVGLWNCIDEYMINLVSYGQTDNTNVVSHWRRDGSTATTNRLTWWRADDSGVDATMFVMAKDKIIEVKHNKDGDEQISIDLVGWKLPHNM